VTLNTKKGFINPEGIEVIPPVYDRASDFFQCLALVRLNDKWGVIDTLGRMVVPVKYEETRFILGDDLFISVMQNSKWGVVNRKGITVLDVKYDSIYIDHFKIAFKLNGRQGHLNKEGKEVWNEDNRNAKVIVLSILFVSLLVISLSIIAIKRKKSTISHT